MSVKNVLDLISSPGAQALLGVLLGLLGWDKVKGKAATKAKRLERRVLEAAVHAAHDVGDLLKSLDVAADQAVARWDQRWSSYLVAFGIDIGDVATDLRVRAMGIARTFFNELHLYTPMTEAAAKQRLRDAAANFGRSFADGTKQLAEAEAALIRASAATKRRRAAKGG